MFGLNRTTEKFCDLKGKVAIVTGLPKEWQGRFFKACGSRSKSCIVRHLMLQVASWLLMKLKKCVEIYCCKM